jgi:hypothetical protein
MNLRTVFITAILALIGWVAVALASPRVGNVTSPGLTGYQLADNDDAKHRDKDQAWDWYQGQRGRWYKDKDKDDWRWRGADNDQWYQGHPGHWYQEQNGWQFATPDTICNNAGRNCRRGGYLPPNGEGMVSRKNPRMFWHCDSEGHNCNWAHRPF